MGFFDTSEEIMDLLAIAGMASCKGFNFFCCENYFQNILSFNVDCVLACWHLM